MHASHRPPRVAAVVALVVGPFFQRARAREGGRMRWSKEEAIRDSGRGWLGSNMTDFLMVLLAFLCSVTSFRQYARVWRASGPGSPGQDGHPAIRHHHLPSFYPSRSSAHHPLLACSLPRTVTILLAVSEAAQGSPAATATAAATASIPTATRTITTITTTLEHLLPLRPAWRRLR